MALRAWPVTATVAVLLASCSFGPQLQTRLPQVRDVPVLAGMGPQESLARARTFLASKNYGLAIELFKAAGRDPALEVDSLNGLAIAYDGIGRADLAERYFQKALALRSDDDRTRRNLATFYATSGQQEKRRALLASVPTKPAIASAVAADAEMPQRAALDGTVTIPAAATASVAGLDTLSPLGGAFRPLLVNASLPSSRPVLAGAARPTQVSVVCTGDRPGSAPAPSDGTMTIFRLSVGEVFIAAQPAGESCYLDGGPGVAPVQQAAISNTQYLGLLAAYLDQLNRMQQVAELSVPNRATL